MSRFNIPKKINFTALSKEFECAPTQAQFIAVGWNACLDYITLLPDHGCKIPPHAFSKLVNELRDVSVKYKDSQQLREQVVSVLTSNEIVPNHKH